MSEAEVQGNKISFTNGFRIALVSFSMLWTVVGAITAYAYVIVIPSIANNIIENDKLSRQRDSRIQNAVVENKVLIAKLVGIEEQLKAIKENQSEFKSILKRTAPYERVVR